jgi:flagellar biosynthesis protein FlhG
MEEVARLASGFPSLAPLYDRVILDLAAGLDPTVMRFARSAGRVLVVATDEPTSMTDAYAFMKVLRLAQPSADPWLAINMAENRQSGRRTYEQLAKASEAYLGFRPALAGVIQRDPRVADSIRAQMPTCVRHPQSTAFEDVLRVAEVLAAG